MSQTKKRRPQTMRRAGYTRKRDRHKQDAARAVRTNAVMSKRGR
jgi:hypothetical protein